VIGNYRWRQSLYPAEPEYASIEAKLQQAPAIVVPTITIDGKYDPFTPAGDGAAYRDKFTDEYEHRTFDVGHNMPQEAPGPSPRRSWTSIISRGGRTAV
jgi:pimeloyl-ACP methyl ester carboxylesterase